MVTESETCIGSGFTNTSLPDDRFNEYSKLWDKHENLKKEVERLKKELSKQYLTRGRRELLKKGSC